MAIRQPIVSIIGHVDHGKTTILDKIRGTTIAEREAGRITQHIGATEVPLATIRNVCGELMKDKRFKVPGLLFIDTPGHHSFVTLRARGGALADLAVLIIDINEGFMPQTYESLNILKQYKTPFVIGATKIDLISGWVPMHGKSFLETYNAQYKGVQEILDDKIYNIVGELYNNNFQSERYDRVTDFSKNIGIVPVSGKTGEGLPDLLLVLIGLAQRFLEERLTTAEDICEGTVLEVKDEKGLGTTVDVIIYNGTLTRGDRIVIAHTDKPIATKVKAILKPKPLDEIREPREKFKSVKEVSAAAGVKIAAPSLTGVIAGGLLKVVPPGHSTEDIIHDIENASKITIDAADDGVIIKADAIGSIEALAYELKSKDIPIKRYDIGDVARRDVIDAETTSDELRRVILAFNVKILPDAKEVLADSTTTVFEHTVIYKLIEDYMEWMERTKKQRETELRKTLSYPCKIKLLEGCVFRVSRPAIVGVRVLAGKLRPELKLIREDGKRVGKIKSMQSENESIKEASQGDEIAIAIEGPTVGRQINVNDILYVDITEAEAKRLLELELTPDERDVLQQLINIKRRDTPFWAM